MISLRLRRPGFAGSLRGGSGEQTFRAKRIPHSVDSSQSEPMGRIPDDSGQHDAAEVGSMEAVCARNERRWLNKQKYLLERCGDIEADSRGPISAETQLRSEPHA